MRGEGSSRPGGRTPRRGLPWGRTRAIVAALAAAVAWFSAVTKAAEPLRAEIRWRPDPGDTNRSVVEVAGIPAGSLRRLAQTNWTLPEWQRLMRVVAESGDLITDLNLPSMTGTYEVVDHTVRFVPAFPLAPGVRYRAVFRPDALPDAGTETSEPLVATHHVPARPASSTTVVTQIYPSASVLPENLLKFYLHFSAPMSRGHVYDYIQLRNAAGQEVELPFLELDEELWNPEMTRLTLFLDPGRIKRGVRPLEEVGPSLEEGKNYALVIDRAWQDSAGNPLRESFTKTFSVGAADRDPPDPASWKLEAPSAGARGALTLTFPESLDHALTERVLRVMDGEGRRLAGTVNLSQEEHRWSFVPVQPWPRGPYRLVIPTIIEDLAGNNIGKPFEVDLVEPVERQVTHSVVTLSFAVQ